MQSSLPPTHELCLREGAAEVAHRSSVGKTYLSILCCPSIKGRSTKKLAPAPGTLVKPI